LNSFYDSPMINKNVYKLVISTKFQKKNLKRIVKTPLIKELTIAVVLEVLKRKGCLGIPNEMKPP